MRTYCFRYQALILQLQGKTVQHLSSFSTFLTNLSRQEQIVFQMHIVSLRKIRTHQSLSRCFSAPVHQSRVGVRCCSTASGWCPRCEDSSERRERRATAKQIKTSLIIWSFKRKGSVFILNYLDTRKLKILYRGIETQKIDMWRLNASFKVFLT